MKTNICIMIVLLVAAILASGCTEKSADKNSRIFDASDKTMLKESNEYLNISGILVGIVNRTGPSCTILFKDGRRYSTINGCNYPYFFDQIHNYSMKKIALGNSTSYLVQDASIPVLDDFYWDPSFGLMVENKASQLTVIGIITGMESNANDLLISTDKKSFCILSFEESLHIPTDNGCKMPHSFDQMHKYSIEKINIGYNSTYEIFRVANVTIMQ